MQGIYKGGGWEWFFGGTPGLLPEVEILMGKKRPTDIPSGSAGVPQECPRMGIIIDQRC